VTSEQLLQEENSITKILAILKQIKLKSYIGKGTHQNLFQNFRCCPSVTAWL